MIVQSIAGLFIVAGLAWLMSENRKEAKLKIAGSNFDRQTDGP
jgi:nucleoside permease NupC